MIYDNSQVRRQARLLSEERAKELLSESEWGVLSMVDTDGESAYGIPLNFVWDGDSALYIHCAKEGHKLRALELHPRVSFTIVGKVQLQSAMLTTEYESVVMRGVANVHLNDNEKRKGLTLMVQKLCADHLEKAMQGIERSFAVVDVIRIDLVTYSGKCKYMK